MSVIHDALQNVETYFADNEKQLASQQKKKNQLYRANRFSITLHNNIYFLLLLAGISSVAYIAYTQFSYENYTTVASGLPEEETENYAVDDVLDKGTISLEDTHVDFSDFTVPLDEQESIVDITNMLEHSGENILFGDVRPANIALIKEDADAIYGEIVDSNTYIVNRAAVGSTNNDIVFEDDVYIPSDEALIEDSVIIAETSSKPSNYFDRQTKAYQYIVEEHFIKAKLILEEILLVDSNDYYANINMVLVHIKESRFSEAYKRLLYLKKLYPFQPRIDELANIVEEYRNG